MGRVLGLIVVTSLKDNCRPKVFLGCMGQFRAFSTPGTDASLLRRDDGGPGCAPAWLGPLRGAARCRPIKLEDRGADLRACLPLAGRVTEMASLLECNARAALCRRLAKLEPVSRDIWLAEAERWSRLAQARLLAQTSDGRVEEPVLAPAMPVRADRECD
jgi:hypothetical protein